jgi:hypothetical protein
MMLEPLGERAVVTHVSGADGGVRLMAQACRRAGVAHVSGADGGVRLLMMLEPLDEPLSRTSLVRTEAIAS